jgi:hypothetical protein
MTKSNKKTFGISFPKEEILNAGKERAESLGLSFSTYVNILIRRDMERKALNVLEEPKASYSSKKDHN